jgi:hypothetical protein
MDQDRLNAKNAGSKTYDGKPCQHGHGTQRYVSTGGCVECGRTSALAAYHKRRTRLLTVPTPSEPAIVMP